MERNEAIVWLKLMKDQYPQSTVATKAIDMAISALSAEPSENKSVRCKDCKWYKNCEYFDPHNAPCRLMHDIRTETHECVKETHDSDLISRADAMGAVQDHFNDDGFKGYDDGQKMLDRINALPSADRPTPNYITESPNDVDKTDDEVIERPIIEHDREWVIGCIKHDGFIKTDRFDKANQIILEALQAEPSEYACWLESIIVTDEPCWLCEDSIDDEWCHKNCGTKSSIQAECLRHFFKVLSTDSKEKNDDNSLLTDDSAECKEQKSKLDLISRADAVKAIEELPNCYNGWSDTYDKAYIITTLEEVPSVSAERVGEWEYDFDKDDHYCTRCHKYAGDWEMNLLSDYCPSCGARMENEK